MFALETKAGVRDLCAVVALSIALLRSSEARAQQPTPAPAQSQPTEGLRPGFVFRVRYTPCLSSGKFDGSNVSVLVVDAIDAHVGLGGRLRLADRLSLTLEADPGLNMFSYMSVSDFNEAEAAKLGVKL